MDLPATVNASIIQKWIANNHSMEIIQAELQEMGHDDYSIEEHIRAFKKVKYAGRQSKGFIFLVSGAVLGFISCLLTIINPVPEIYYLILYGLTSIAVLLICAGLYYLLE